MGLYSTEFGYEFVLSLVALLLVLSIMRVLAVKYSPAKTRGTGSGSHIAAQSEEPL